MQRGQRAQVLHRQLRRNDRLVDLLLESPESVPATLPLSALTSTTVDAIASAHTGDELLSQA